MRTIARRGFTFIEVMFAVVVLGIGMIGVAAALSVGSATVQTTYDESTAARVAAGAYSTLSHVMTAANTKSLGSAYVGFDVTDDLKTALQQELIAADRRYAWIPLYQRVDENSTIAQVIVVVVRCVSGTEYTSADVVPATPDMTSANPPTLMPRTINAVTATKVDGGFDTISFDIDGDDPNPNQADVVASGAIVVTKGVGGNGGGGILKVGELLDAKKHLWSLAPGYDCKTDGGYTGPAFVVGRGYADPNHPTANFAGASQAVAAYAMMVELH